MKAKLKLIKKEYGYRLFVKVSRGDMHFLGRLVRVREGNWHWHPGDTKPGMGNYSYGPWSYREALHRLSGVAVALFG